MSLKISQSFIIHKNPESCPRWVSLQLEILMASMTVFKGGDSTHLAYLGTEVIFTLVKRAEHPSNGEVQNEWFPPLCPPSPLVLRNRDSFMFILEDKFTYNLTMI
jgi:hypothetical protein